jgi:CRP/FNR family transcriptional regulator, cyclic AMP receptor protein
VAGVRFSGVEWELFDDLPSAELSELLAISRRRRFRKGEVVFHRGDPADSLHLIVTGRFAVRITTALGDSALLALYGPGQAFGELALLSADAKRSATVAALEDAETRSIYRDDLMRLQQRYPQVNNVLLALVAEKVRRSDQRTIEAYYLDAETRVRRRLLELAEIYGSDEGEAVIPLTQEEIGEMAGTSRATVNRVLRDEHRRGVLELRRGRTIIRAPHDLIRRARLHL